MTRPARRYRLPFPMRRTPVRIEPGAALALVADGALLVDVRRRDDHTAVLEGASRIPPDQVPSCLDGFLRDVPIVLACT